MRPTYKRPSDGRLKDMILTHMATSGFVAKANPRADFIMSACRAANIADPFARRKILSEMADVMNCDVCELEFLFTHQDRTIARSKAQSLEVPDFRQELLLAAE